jgi:glycosyltransferase involved in cell wall biosynthesis
MRYCLVSRELAPFFGAGIGTYASQMARAMAGAGHDVTVITGPHSGLERAAELLPVVRVVPAEPEGHSDHARLPFHFQRHAAAVRRLLLELHAEAPLDIIEFPDYYGEGCWALWGRRSLGELPGARVLCHLHMTTALCRELNEERRTNLETLAMQAAERETIRLADALVSPSAALLERTCEDLAAVGVAVPPGVAIPYPFDVAAARRDLGASADRADRATEVASGTRDSGRRSGQPAAPAAPSATSVSSEATPDILFFGRLERRKGPDLLARTAVRLLEHRPDLRIRFIGGDTNTGPGQSSMRAHLQRLTKDHADNFAFFDRVERASLGAEITAAKVICLPSRWDNFPNALLEAMSLGACCIASGPGAGGMSEIIEDGASGILCGAEDEAALAAALARALDDDDLRRRLGVAARERIEGQCDPQAIVTQRVSHMESVAPSPLSRPAGRASPTRIVTVAVEGDWRRRARAAAREGAAVALIRPGEATGEAFVKRCAEALRRTGADLACSCALSSAPVGLDREALAAAEWSGPIVATRPALEYLAADAPDEVARWSLVCDVALRGGELAVIPEPLVSRTQPAPARLREWIADRHPTLAPPETEPAPPRQGLLERLGRKLRGRET